QSIDVGPAFRRWTMSDAVLEHNPEISAADLRDVGAMRAHCERRRIKIKPGYGWGKLLLEVFEATGEHTLIQPTFITRHPVEVSPLTSASDDDAGMTERCGLVVG